MSGTTLGDTCGRPTPGWATPRCTGTIEVVASGTDGNGQPRDVLGCTTCWTTLEPGVAPLVDVPLFGGDT